MSANDRPELRAYRELETLVRHLGEELATFRRRAISAEAQLKDAGHAPAGGRGPSSGASSDLASENEALRKRLAAAEDRVRQMMDRVRFLRQQLQTQVPTVGSGRS